MNPTPSKEFYVIGLNYKKADVAMRSSFSLSKDNQELLLKEAKNSDVNGVIVLSTCNRIEIMGFAEHPFRLISLLCKYSQGTVEDFADRSYVYKNRDAAKHVIRVATGIESQILGDYEIVGQLKDAYQLSKNAGMLNAYIDRLFSIALQASKEVKNETSLSSGTTTVSYAAVQYIKTNFKDLSGKRVLVYGLGDIGLKTAKSCVAYLNECPVSVVNRTDSKSVELANEIAVQAVPHSNLVAEIKKADFIIVATGAPEPTVLKKDLPEQKPQLIIDLSIPRNVETDISTQDNKLLIDLDLLSNMTEQTLENRKKQIPIVEAIINKYNADFIEWLHFRKSIPAISSFKKSLETIQNETIASYSKKHDIDTDHVENITTQMVNKLVSKFAAHLKEDNSQAIKSINVMNQIFKIDILDDNHG